MFTGFQKTKARVGQALVELAVFGAFFLLILSAMITYGLKAEFQQKGQMVAFRRALAIASGEDSDGTVRGAGSYTILQHKSVPDIYSAHGMGPSLPVGGAASVSRNYLNPLYKPTIKPDQLISGAEDIETNRIAGQGSAQYMRRGYFTSAFRREFRVNECQARKYNLIYGGNNVIAEPDYDNDEEDPDDCDTGEVRDLWVIDACSGEKPDYGSCYQQSRMLVDRGFCIDRCNLYKIPGSDQNCSAECGEVTNPPNQNSVVYDPSRGGAWYAANYTRTCEPPYICGYDAYGNPRWCQGTCSGYVFPHLDELFSFTGNRPDAQSMGLQPDMVTSNVRDDSLTKTETPTGITTDESVSWSDTYDRSNVRNDNVDEATGKEITHPTPGGFVNVATENITSEISGGWDQRWSTPK